MLANRIVALFVLLALTGGTLARAASCEVACAAAAGSDHAAHEEHSSGQATAAAEAEHHHGHDAAAEPALAFTSAPAPPMSGDCAEVVPWQAPRRSADVVAAAHVHVSALPASLRHKAEPPQLAPAASPPHVLASDLLVPLLPLTLRI